MTVCQILRKYFDHPALTTDVIVGFPGETEEEFEASYAFVDRVDFYETHIFKYSKREGTKAAVMDGQIDEQDQRRRKKPTINCPRRKRKRHTRTALSEKKWKFFLKNASQIEWKGC